MWYTGWRWLTAYGIHVGRITAWKNTKPTAALIAPSTVRAPSVTTSTIHASPSSGTNTESMFDAVPRCVYVTISPPPSPAIAADSANATMRARRWLIPIDDAATSLPRIASSERPVVPPRTQITAMLTSTRMISERTRYALSPWLKSIGPSTGRGTTRICVPPPTQPSWSTTWSKKNANASVASDKKMPPRRIIGIAITAPTAAAITAPTNIALITGSPACVASCAVAAAPTAANVAWHSEIWPAKPVITVIDKKMIERIVARTARSIHDGFAWKNSQYPTTAKNTTAKPRVILVRLALRSAWAGAGGGGSTPDIGSVIVRRRAITGDSTSTPNATTNGSAGLKALAMMLFVGRYW